LLVRQTARNLYGPDIGIGDAKIFGLAPRIAAQQMGITKQSGRRMAPELASLLLVRVGSFASRIESALAEIALPAGNCERDDDPVTLFQRGNLCANLDDFTHRLMAKNVPILHAGDQTIVNMQIGAADGAASHPDNGVG
jgi:hypothetical protein